MHPVLFHIGNFVIGTYGVLIVIGMLAGLGVMARLALRRGLPVEFFYDLLFIALLSGFIGARLTFIGLEWDEFLRDPLAMILSRQGFVFLGGFVTATATAIWFTRRRGVPLLEVADVVAPGVVLGHAFGRIGCFLAGCCYGVVCTPAEHPLLSRVAVSFPVAHDPDGAISRMFNFAYQNQIINGELPPTATHSLPMLPVQLIESLGNFLICLALLWLWRRRRFSGQIAALYLVLYSLLRFGLEFVRGDIDRGVYFEGTISTSQIVCIFTLAAGLALFFVRRGKGLQPIPARIRTPADSTATPKSGGPRRGRSERQRDKPSPQP